MSCKHYPEMKSSEMKQLCMRIFYHNKDGKKNMIITCLFEKTSEKTTSGVMSSSEEDAQQPKRIIEK